MGNYGLVRALSSLATERPALLANVKEVILTAPDIDSGAFKNQIKPVLNAKNQSVTLYASSADKALMAARLAYKNPRAGYSGKDIVLLKGLVTIDATNIETDFLSHSYFSDSPTVLSDISYLIKKELKPTERSFLKRKDSIKGSYWEFAKLTD
jgi:esterase/lipase superfamily enzyme